MYDILEGRAEVDRVLVNNDEFLVCMDMKWDGKDPNLAYYLVLVKDRSLKSVRDLRGKHLEMLIKMRDTMHHLHASRPEAPLPNEMMLYIHYPPTFYHFHVHACHMAFPQRLLNAPVCRIVSSSSCRQAGRAVLLDDVIQNIQIDPEYYAVRDITMTLGTAWI